MATEMKDKKSGKPAPQAAKAAAAPARGPRGPEGATGAGRKAPKEEAPAPPVTVAELKGRYEREVKPALKQEFGYRNVMEVPRVEKVVLNIGMGEAVSNAKALDAAASDIATITGQRPVVTRSRRSISNFRLRKGMPIGLKVTLRGLRMWHFLEKLSRVALPRIRDFQGLADRSFDGRGNFSLGLREQLVFPEVDYDKIDRLRGMQITIATTAKTDKEGQRLLQLLGMPFRKG